MSQYKDKVNHNIYTHFDYILPTLSGSRDAEHIKSVISTTFFKSTFIERYEVDHIDEQICTENMIPPIPEHYSQIYILEWQHWYLDYSVMYVSDRY